MSLRRAFDLDVLLLLMRLTLYVRTLLRVSTVCLLLVSAILVGFPLSALKPFAWQSLSVCVCVCVSIVSMATHLQHHSVMSSLRDVFSLLIGQDEQH